MELSLSILPRTFRSLLITLVAAVFLQGCNLLPTISWDDATESSVPVTEQTSSISREDIIANAGEVKAGEIVKVGDRTMMMGNLYMSASGLKCRKVTILGGQGMETRLACKEGPDWCLTQPVITK